MPNIGRESQNMPNIGRESQNISLRCQKKNKFQILNIVGRESHKMPNIGRESQNMPTFGRESPNISMWGRINKFFKMPSKKN